MKKVNNLPRVVAINSIDGFVMSIHFNTGENRLVDFKELFEKKTAKNDPLLYEQLLTKEKFNSVQVQEGTLQWTAIHKTISLNSGKSFEVLFDVDPTVIYEASKTDTATNEKGIGSFLQSVRLEEGLTQEQLASKSGITKKRIQQIEADETDVTYREVKQFIEVGLNRKLELTLI